MASFEVLKTVTFCNFLLLIVVILVLFYILGYFDVFVVKEGMSKSSDDKTLMVFLWIFIAVVGYVYATVILGPLFGIGSKRVSITDEQWKFD